MSADFKIKDGEEVRTRICAIGSSTVLEPGDMVAISSGLIVKAGATSAKIAFCPKGSLDGETEVEVTEGNNFTLLATADANYAVTDQGLLCDIVGTTTLLADIGTSSTNVLQIGLGKNAGTAGSTANVEVKINKPIF